MSKEKLGTKRDCFSCETKFYDFGKPEPICPHCGANQTTGDEGEPAVVIDPDDDAADELEPDEDEVEEVAELGAESERENRDDELDDEQHEVDDDGFAVDGGGFDDDAQDDDEDDDFD